MCPSILNFEHEFLLPLFHPRGVVFFGCPHRFVTKQLADPLNTNSSHKQLNSEHVSKPMAQHFRGAVSNTCLIEHGPQPVTGTRSEESRDDDLVLNDLLNARCTTE